MERLHCYLLLIVSLFCSCQQDDMIYSCDPKVDEFIKMNISEIQTMSRMDFLEVERDMQPAIFSAFTIEQKQLVWSQKFQEMLKFTWSDGERNHIKTLLQYIKDKKCYFEEPELNSDSIAIFAYKWTKYAKEELMWDDETIYNMVYTPEKVIKDTNGKLMTCDISKNNSLGIAGRLKTRNETTPPPTVKCTCNTQSNQCGTTGLMTCRKWNCIAVYGCGYLFQQVCDGGCYRNDL